MTGIDMLDRLRPLTTDEQSMLDRHTALGLRDQPRLVIDQQSFDIDNAGRPWQRERAEWYRRQMAIALARMVKAETDALEREIAAARASAQAMAEALKLAENRLHRRAVDFDTGSHEFIETSEWAADARNAITALEAAQC